MILTTFADSIEPTRRRWGAAVGADKGTDVKKNETHKQIRTHSTPFRNRRGCTFRARLVAFAIEATLTALALAHGCGCRVQDHLCSALLGGIRERRRERKHANTRSIPTRARARLRDCIPVPERKHGREPLENKKTPSPVLRHRPTSREHNSTRHTIHPHTVMLRLKCVSNMPTTRMQTKSTLAVTLISAQFAQRFHLVHAAQTGCRRRNGKHPHPLPPCGMHAAMQRD